MPARVSRALLALAALLLVTGCGFNGIYSVPLPGGAPTPNAYQVKAEFQNVSNLVPASAVKVNELPVGTVTKIEPVGRGGDWRARVTMRISGDVALPDNTRARLAQTSVLGAKFIALSPPSDQPPRGRLTDGEVIPVRNSGRFPEVETVLTSLSLLLNRGGLGQIQTITTELNAALDGRESAVRDLLGQLDTFVGSLEQQKGDIVAALEGLNRLSAELGEQKQVVADAVEELPAALRVLNAQQEDLTRLLTALSDFGDVATRVINLSREDLLANLRALQPILARLADAGERIPRTLGLLVNFPFPDTAPGAIAGDYVNLDVTVDTSLATLTQNLLGGRQGPLGDLARPIGDAAQRVQGGGNQPPPNASTSGTPDTAPAPGEPDAAPSSSPPSAPPGARAPQTSSTPRPPQSTAPQQPGGGGLLDLLPGGGR